MSAPSLPTSPRFVLGNLNSSASAQGSSPRRGAELDKINEISEPAIVVEEGKILWIGPECELPDEYREWDFVNGAGGTLLPGFVDPHTHLVFAGERSGEFEMRARGAAYLDILAAGGGILSTMQETRKASEEELFEASAGRMRRLLEGGTTTVEIKSGYGLNLETELKMLRVARRLGRELPQTVRTTFLGAHATPPEYKGRSDEYVQVVVREMLPEVAASGLADYVDVFCETGVFDLKQTRHIVETAQEFRLPARLHADEVHAMGGGALAAKLGTRSADHLIATDDASITALAASDTAATLLPGTAFVLGKGRWAPARKMLEAGCILALASDLNPGSCHMESMAMVMQIATVQMGLTPGEALAAATLNAACTLDLGDKVGTLDVGKQADLVVLGAPNFRHLGYRMGVNLIEQVFVAGKQVLGDSSGFPSGEGLPRA
jgi:imidazolonepropionase